MKLNKKCMVLFLVFLSTCSSTDNREKKILDFTEIGINKYEVFLVDIDKYTTSGADYHRKYYKYLIGIARIAIEENKLNVVEKSIGFYYDLKENIQNKLYLGLDISPSPDTPLQYSSYEQVAVVLLDRYLSDILYILNSCKTIFSEEDIFGTVIGIEWTRFNRAESVTIWIDRKDIISFENNKVTLKELIQKNYVTNTEGKIVMLPVYEQFP